MNFAVSVRAAHTKSPSTREPITLPIARVHGSSRTTVSPFPHRRLERINQKPPNFLDGRASVHAQPIHTQGNPRLSPGRERAPCRSAVRRLGRTAHFWPVGSSRGDKILASRSVGRVGASLGERGAWPSLWSRASRRPRQPPSLPGRPSPGRTLARPSPPTIYAEHPPLWHHGGPKVL